MISNNKTVHFLFIINNKNHNPFIFLSFLCNTLLYLINTKCFELFAVLIILNKCLALDKEMQMSFAYIHQEKIDLHLVGPFIYYIILSIT